MDDDYEDYLPEDISPLQWEPDPVTHCWVWTGPLSRGKYIRYQTNYGEREYLHRVIAANRYGVIPPWQRVSWTCGNTRCINAEHIMLVNKENAVPAKRKLTDEQVQAIINDSRSYRILCKEYNVSYSLIEKIKCGRRRELKNTKGADDNGQT